MTRDLDLLVFGATGFAGGVACEYLAKHAPAGFRWAIAGRSLDKLERVRAGLKNHSCPPQECLVADNGDAEAVGRAIQRTRTVLTYAGPFARYGETIVEACAQQGAHYLDITGETVWVADMQARYGTEAKRSGAVLIPFSGFDSVPSDMGVWQVLKRAQAQGAQPDRVVNLITARGGFNGGTFATMLDVLAMEESERNRFQRPVLLVPAAQQGDFPFPQLNRPVRVPEAGVTAPPFFMERMNSRVVYQSQAHRGECVEYQELLRITRWFSGFASWLWVLGSEGFERLARKAWALRALRRFGLKPGQGPTVESQAKGFFRNQLFAYQGHRCVARLEMSYPGDPSNRATAFLSCESALAIHDAAQAGKLPAGGFWTPSTAVGDILWARLQAAGLKVV